MKALYIYKVENTIKYSDKKDKWYVVTRSSKQFNARLRYGEIPTKLSHTYFADELPSVISECYNKSKHLYNLELIHVHKRLFSKDKYELVVFGQDSDSSFHDTYIKLENVSYITASTYAEVYDKDKFTFDYIMRHLSADEFIDFCKDNGLNCITVVKGE